jgi:adenine-specific DNA-methyltransferase
VKKNIFGSDILPYNIRRAKLLLTIYALQNNEFLEETDFNLFCQDSLKIKWKTGFDNILGNPPYVKFQDLPDKTREYLPGKWTTADEGAFNLYFAFFELGYKLLKPSGRLGYITPNNYFTSLAGQSIRKYFHQKKCISKIIDFSHKKVFKAQTYTAITFLNKQENEAIMYDRIKEGCEPASFLSIANGSPNYLEKLNHRKWRLLKTDEQKNIQIIETIGTPIGKLFDICTGIATLKDELFFVDTRTEQQGFYTKSTDKGLFRIEKEITRAVYKIPDFKTQEETAGNNRRIICPYVIKDGTATPVPEARFKLKYPECYAYLHSEKEALLARDKHKVVFDPFFAWGRTQSLTHTGKKILTPTFSRQPRFLLIEEEDAFFTNGYGIYFKNQAPAMQAGISMEIVRKILNSCLMHYYVSKTSIAIQGGYPCYQKNFIEKFTIPEFSGTEIQLMETLDNKQEMDEFLIRKYRLNIESGSTKDTKYIGYIKQVK